MYLDSDKDGVQHIFANVGDVLNSCIENCITICETKDCKVLLNFNGVERHINKGTYAKGLIDNWYDETYISLQDSRDQKLNDLGI